MQQLKSSQLVPDRVSPPLTCELRQVNPWQHSLHHLHVCRTADELQQLPAGLLPRTLLRVQCLRLQMQATLRQSLRGLGQELLDDLCPLLETGGRAVAQ